MSPTAGPNQSDATVAHLQDADIENLPVPKIDLDPFGNLSRPELIHRPAQEAKSLWCWIIEQLNGAREIRERGAIDNQPATTGLQIHSSTHQKVQHSNKLRESLVPQFDLAIP
jgi:hypothetical protein